MFFRRLSNDAVAHLSYILGDDGVAVVVDPGRDVDAVLHATATSGLQVAYILETHRQEDFVIGSRELARRTGAKIVCGRHELFGHGDLWLDDDDRLDVGSLSFRALYTPGHTPESTSYAVYVKGAPDVAWGVLSGDTLLAGGTGRVDLAGSGEAAANAAALYASVHERLLPLGDQTIVLPAHGPGSASSGPLPSRELTTIGLERATNPVFLLSRRELVELKIGERLPRPPTFADMEKVNLEGGLGPARTPDSIPLVTPRALRDVLSRVSVLDTRDPTAYAGGHIPGAFNVALAGLGSSACWVANRQTALYLVVDRPADVATACHALSTLGLDRIEGVLRSGFGSWRDEGMPIERSGTITPLELSEALDQYKILDVRDEPEVAATGRVPGAAHVFVGHLVDRVADPDVGLRTDARVAVICGTGEESGLAASILRRRGFLRVYNVLGGMKAWRALGLPVD